MDRDTTFQRNAEVRNKLIKFVGTIALKWVRSIVYGQDDLV